MKRLVPGVSGFGAASRILRRLVSSQLAACFNKPSNGELNSDLSSMSEMRLDTWKVAPPHTAARVPDTLSPGLQVCG